VQRERRNFIKACTGGLLAVTAPAAFAKPTQRPDRALSFYNTHTGERVTATYWSHGRYLSDGLHEINFVLRDFRSGDVIDMNRDLLDLLYTLHEQVGAKKPFHLISGYRSPKTNAMLRSKSSGVAKRSLHMDGKATDIRLPGVKLVDLRRAALGLKAGGVGYYPRSNFIHVDVGRVRAW
jgi:uncharacterized protein YcbK (DUF882 family)